MNIHLTESEFNALSLRVILSIKVGSHLYGMTNTESDTDILNIYALPEDNHHSLVHSHHQFQYKGEKVDYLFCSVQSFVKNILMGDSTLNFEALDSAELKAHDDFKILSEFKSKFVNYQLVKGYLGLARRDLKVAKKDSSNKKLYHALRGFLTAKCLYEKREYFNDFSCFTEEEVTILKNLKSNEITSEDKNALVSYLIKEVDSLREQLNTTFNNQAILRVMDVTQLQALDRWVIVMSKKYTKPGAFENQQYLDSIQSEITYES